MKILYLLFLLIFLLPSPASAHTLEGELLPAACGAAAVRFTYSSGETARFIKVEVYSPENRETEFQNCRTDLLGRAVFIPDTPGEWLLVASDNQGHRTEYSVSVRATEKSGQAESQTDAQKTGENTAQSLEVNQAAEPAPTNKALKAALGLSLILNLAFLALWRTRRKNK